MTKSSIKKYFVNLAKASSITFDDLDAHIDRCIELGLARFWGAKNWTFRMKSAEITTSTEAEAYDLPEDFSKYVTAREKGSYSGGWIRHMSKTQFDAVFPKPTAHTSNYPIACTTYKDTGDDVWKIQFMPIPSVSPVYVFYLSTKASSVVAIPDDFISGLLLAIESYLYPIGNQRIAALQLYQEELKRLEVNDSRYAGDIFKILDDTDVQMKVTRPWID